MMKVNILILHWAHLLKDGSYLPWNDILFNCIGSMKRAIDNQRIDNEIIVVYDCNKEFLGDLMERCPKDVRLVEDYKKKGASGGRNVGIELSDDFFVIVDNDMKVNNGWLINLVTELKSAENYFGYPCAISYSQMPYLEEGVIRAEEYGNVVRKDEFINWCKTYNVNVDSNGIVYSNTPYEGKIDIGGTGVTYSGWRLSNFIANKKFIEIAGYSSEELYGWWGEDMEWAYRTFQTECRLLESHTVFIQHIVGFTSGMTVNDRINNADIMIKKYGNEFFDGVSTGNIWNKLRYDQIAKYGYTR